MSSSPERGDLPPQVPETQKEQLKRRMLLIYRDNALFRQHIPAVVDALTSLDYQIIQQKFEEGTPEEEIAKWAENNLKIVNDPNSGILTDATFPRSVFVRRGPTQVEYRKGVGKLDELMEGATIRAIFGSGWPEEGGPARNLENRSVNLETGGKMLLALINRILANEGNRPDHVVIVAKRLSDHYPFYEILLEEKQKMKYDYEKAADSRAADMLSAWLEESGVPKGQIEIVTDVIDIPEDRLTQQSWTIGDRHNLVLPDSVYAEEMEKKPDDGLYFNMPLTNFFQLALKYKMLDINPAELDSALRDLVREKFAK